MRFTAIWMLMFLLIAMLLIYGDNRKVNERQQLLLAAGLSLFAAWLIVG